MLGLVDDAHAAFADPLFQAVALADHRAQDVVARDADDVPCTAATRLARDTRETIGGRVEASRLGPAAGAGRFRAKLLAEPWTGLGAACSGTGAGAATNRQSRRSGPVPAPRRT